MASLTRLAIGYAIAAVVGVLLGIVMTMIGPWNLGITPLLAALLAIPSVAYVPLSIVWFGPTNVAVVAVVALVASPPIATGTVRGLTAVPLRYKQAAKVLGASGFFYLRTIVMPSAGPNLIAGAQQGWTFAWRALVSGELLIKGGIGLGRSLETARASDDLATVFAVLAVIAFFSLALDTFLRRMAEN